MLRTALFIALLPVAGHAQMICTAERQCRGDAERMCAESTLRIEAQRGGQGARLWIDWQGPYDGSLRRTDGVTRIELGAFGGGYVLEAQADGTFIYYGNRGKRFYGTCDGTLDE